MVQQWDGAWACAVSHIMLPPPPPGTATPTPPAFCGAECQSESLRPTSAFRELQLRRCPVRAVVRGSNANGPAERRLWPKPPRVDQHDACAQCSHSGFLSSAGAPTGYTMDCTHTRHTNCHKAICYYLQFSIMASHYHAALHTQPLRRAMRTKNRQADQQQVLRAPSPPRHSDSVCDCVSHPSGAACE